MISEIYILFFKASLTIRHTPTVSQKKSGTSKKIQWDFQISRVGSLDFLDLKVNGSPVNCNQHFVKRKCVFSNHSCKLLDRGGDDLWCVCGEGGGGGGIE